MNRVLLRCLQAHNIGSHNIRVYDVELSSSVGSEIEVHCQCALTSMRRYRV